MRLFGSRRRGPPGGPDLPGVLPVTGRATAGVRCSAGAVSFPIRFPSRARCRPSRRRRGVFTVPSCVNAARPREPSGCPSKPREVPVLAPVRVAPVGAGRERRRAAVRPELSRAPVPPEKRAEREREGPGLEGRWGRGRGKRARSARTARLLLRRAAACRGASRPVRGASVSGPRPPRRVAVSSSTSGALCAARRGDASEPGFAPPSGPPSAPTSPAAGRAPPPTGRRGGPASGAGQPRPSPVPRAARATTQREAEPLEGGGAGPHPRARREREERERERRGKAQNRTKQKKRPALSGVTKLRSGPGSLPAASREGPAAGGRPSPRGHPALPAARRA